VLDTHADYALEVLGDMFFNSTFDEGELEKEKNVVLEEIKMYDDTPDDLVHDLLSKVMYETHPLGYPILGTEETLKSFNGDTLRQYMKDFYTPDQVVISIAGNIDESFIKRVEDLFGNYEGKKKEINFGIPTIHYGQIARKKETEQAHLCVGYRGLELGHSDLYPLIALNNILGGSMSSRLFQDVREQKGLAYSVFSYHSAYHDSGTVAIYAGTGKSQLNQLFETIQETLKVLNADGITEKELNNCKEQLKGNLMLGLESTNSRMSRNGKNELMLGNHRTLDEVIQLIDDVTIDKVNNIAKFVFTDDYAVSLVSPDGVIPTNIKQ
jgi:predicted Zn-dependent peptidase